MLDGWRTQVERSHNMQTGLELIYKRELPIKRGGTWPARQKREPFSSRSCCCCRWWSIPQRRISSSSTRLSSTLIIEQSPPFPRIIIIIPEYINPRSNNNKHVVLPVILLYFVGLISSWSMNQIIENIVFFSTEMAVYNTIFRTTARLDHRDF